MEYKQEDYKEDRRIANWVFNKHFINFDYLKEDLIQSGVIALWQAREKFDKSKGRYMTYAYHCAFREMLSLLRNEKQYFNQCSIYEEVDEDLLLVDILCEEPDSVFEQFEKQVFKDKIKELLSSLDSKTQKIIDLYLKDYNQYEIADFVDLDQSSVSRHIKKFNNLLKREFQGVIKEEKKKKSKRK